MFPDPTWPVATGVPVCTGTTVPVGSGVVSPVFLFTRHPPARQEMARRSATRRGYVRFMDLDSEQDLLSCRKEISTHPGYAPFG
jgi:hypothetical protein